VEWIGEIPEHWEMKRLGHLVRMKNGYSFKPEDYVETGIPVIRIGDIQEEIDFNQCKFISKESVKEYEDFIINKKSVLLALTGATIGKSCIYNYSQESLLNQRVGLFEDNEKIHIDYLYLWFNSNYFREYIYIECDGGAQENIGKEQLNSHKIALPPYAEQLQILTWLNEEKSKLTALITQKQKLITLLREERTALINQAVTRGINPKAKRKDSGVEWLGEIPAHWEVKKISHSFGLIGSGTTPKSDDPSFYENGDINWLQTGDLTDGEIVSTSKKINKIAIETYSTLKIYPENSLVIAMYGATIGKAGILKIQASTNQACCVLSSSDIFCVEFVFYWFISNKDIVVNLASGGGQPNISQEIIRSLRLPAPDMSEQKEIVSYIQTKTTQIDQTITRIEREIELLQEYRTALISEVVTGKICVV
jgi:type I restriction enzyme S subunit